MQAEIIVQTELTQVFTKQPNNMAKYTKKVIISDDLPPLPNLKEEEKPEVKKPVKEAPKE